MAVKKAKTDPAHDATERLLAEMEQKIAKEYAQAERELSAKIADYFRRFELKDQRWREWVKDGDKTKEEYQAWRVGQMAVGKRWESMKETIAQDLHHANDVARSIAYGYMPDVYAENFNYGTYEAEVGAKVDTSFTLYDKQTVERLMRDDPKLLPDPGKKKRAEIAAGQDVLWNKQQVQSVMMQGILQGESIPKLANRLAREVGEKDHRAAIRNARTMTTGAQNAGRVDSYKRAEDMGIKMVQEWRATLDMRTRHSHRQLDGERQPVGERFSNGCEYPGDPSGDPAEIYNCRCTLRAVVAGLEPQARKYRDDSMIEGMTYDEWKESRLEKPEPITLQEEKGEAIRQAYLAEYRRGSGSPKANGQMAHDTGYSDKRVYYNENATYKIDIDGYSKEANNGMSMAARQVAKFGSRRGYEYSAVVDLNTGEIVNFGSDGEPGTVGYYHKFLRENLDGRYAMIHNHNTENPLSFPDLQEFVGWENIEVIGAVSNNGITSVVVSNGKKTNTPLDLVYEEYSRELRKQGLNNRDRELALANKAIEDFSLGGMIVYDGRRD